MDEKTIAYDDIYDALRVGVQTMGGNKAVGARLWPEKMPDKAGELLANCLSTTRPEKLDPEQFMLIVRWSKRAGCHAPMQHMAQNTEYETPKPIEPEDQKERLQREFVQAMQRLDAISQAMKEM